MTNNLNLVQHVWLSSPPSSFLLGINFHACVVDKTPCAYPESANNRVLRTLVFLRFLGLSWDFFSVRGYLRNLGMSWDFFYFLVKKHSTNF